MCRVKTINVNHLRMRDCIHKTEFVKNIHLHVMMYMMSDDTTIPILMEKKNIHLVHSHVKIDHFLTDTLY